MYTPPPLRASNPVLIHGVLCALTPPSGRPRAARRRGLCSCPQGHTPGQRGGTLKARSPVPPHRHPHPQQRPRRHRRIPVWGEEVDWERDFAGLSATPSSPAPLCTDTGCVAPVPDTRAAPHSPGPQPCHTGRAQKWGALPRSPPHRPYRGFFNPLCSLGRLEVPQPSPPRPRRAQVAVTARSGCPSPTWVRRDVSAGPARLRSPLRGLREAPGLTIHVRAASVSLWLSGFRGWEPLGHSPSRLLPRPSALMSPRRRSQWRLGTSAGPLGLRGSNQKAQDPGSFVGGRFGPGGHPGPGPVEPRGAPAWLRSGPDPPPNLGPRGQGRDSPRGPSTRPS